LLKNPWIPPSNYSLPYSVHKKQGPKEIFQSYSLWRISLASAFK
jgi:hypothetical protein